MASRPAIVCLMLIACHGKEQPRAEQKVDQKTAVDPWSRPPVDALDVMRASDVDYAIARRSFHTKLLRESSSPQRSAPVKVAADAREITFESDGHALRAWTSLESKTKRPAVLFLHGGFAFSLEDWEMTKPFRDAGYIVTVPIVRGENGSPGSFSLYYDEVNDVLAAAKLLEQRPDVDQTRIFVAGHSAGGTLAALAALESSTFRGAAPFSGEMAVGTDDPEILPFDASNPEEIRMRSAVVFASSFKCPTRLYYGSEEDWAKDTTEETARRAKAAGRDVEAVVVPGDHFSMLDSAIPAAIAFFDQQQ